eukprot:CAMPEP_0170605306 /NCGR_PEP_ID=MMETSP0224-20130122/19904_1 /TAXON_ID=285029 /ORGANISM="Togula jolla, Strain CCCM 725" /LENGTH=440 /DNA_ID=CAMNT_0010930303 /DNA_START=12 /DNA_END=1335 /DNA_ORIENTATION=+
MDIGRRTAPEVIGQRLCDLLLQFPTASISGVRWSLLLRKYEERYSSQLNLTTLGHSSAVLAATALLWDVQRLVDTENVDDPLIALEDAVVLTPRPGFLASWPSLYATLCDIVRHSGTREVAGGDRTCSLLLSQLKPLLQSNWHQTFDESSLGFLREDGCFVKMKKMKHLIQAVLRWRDDHVEHRLASGAKQSAVDKALRTKLLLIPSKTHNDLVLQCHTASDADLSRGNEPRSAAVDGQQATMAASVDGGLASPTTVTTPYANNATGCSLQAELAILRAENAELRSKNERLLIDADLREQETGLQMFFTDAGQNSVSRLTEALDDPYEPPPQRDLYWEIPSPTRSSVHADFDSVSTSTASMTPRGFEISGTTTRASMTPSFEAQGSRTPFAGSDKVCALVPMWFSLMPSTASFLGDAVPSQLASSSASAHNLSLWQAQMQ